MKFSPYELLSQVIPGFIIYAVLNALYAEQLPEIEVLSSIGIAYILGYFINALSSWLEDFYYWTWCGKPSTQLLKGKDIWKVRLHQKKEIRSSLEKQFSEQQSLNENILFEEAMRVVYQSKNQRISDFNAVYAFARGLLTCTIIASILIWIKTPNTVILYPIFGLLIVIAWLRTKQRAYYYAREVLNTYWQETKNKDADTA